MAFSDPYTFVALELLTAAKQNAIQTNIRAIWVGTTAGDLDYYANATTKSRLGIGTLSTALFSTGSAPEWDSIIHAKYIGNGSPNQNASGTDWNTVNTPVLSVTLTKTCTVLVDAHLMLQTGGANEAIARVVCNGVAGTAVNGTTSTVYDSVGVSDYFTGVTAGTFNVNAQFRDAAGVGAAVARCHIRALAIRG